MTRFERELSGELGAYWKRSAEQEIAELDRKVKTGEISFGADGTCRWKSNNRVLPTDCREKLSHTPYRSLYDEEACKAADEAETAAFLENYRRNHRTTDEERMEMRAAFGEGATVVDVITGERISL